MQERTAMRKRRGENLSFEMPPLTAVRLPCKSDRSMAISQTAAASARGYSDIQKIDSSRWRCLVDHVPPPLIPHQGRQSFRDSIRVLTQAVRKEPLSQELPWIPYLTRPSSPSSTTSLASVQFHYIKKWAVDWSWLEAIAELGQLEHLVVEPEIPFELLCRVVAKCSVC